MKDAILPGEGTWVGRVWHTPNDPDLPAGPSVVSIVDGEVFDISARCSTVAELMGREDRLSILKSVSVAEHIVSLEALTRASLARDQRRTHLLSPLDLQCIKAAGVTFAASLIERMIEERAGGDSSEVTLIRKAIQAEIGDSIQAIRPGSPEAAALGRQLRAKGIWSQYLEVGIGPYAEVFSKAPILSSVGFGQEIGILPRSEWNNPEPELVLVVDRAGEIVGATLGNDVNLRDIEGRSALLLGRAKDNNASCAIGPFIRLFDETFGYDDLLDIVITVEVIGPDGYSMRAESEVRQISRDFKELVSQTSGPHHQYPDGFVLMTGTVYVPIQDRDEDGKGFTHKIGDEVIISAPELGILVNTVQYSDRAPPWSFGVLELMRNLSQRRLLQVL